MTAPRQLLVTLALGLGSTSAAHAQAYTVTELGPAGFDAVFGMNDAGEVVGRDANYIARHWDGATATALGTLGGSTSRADEINELGQMVGLAFTPSAVHHAYLYTNGAMQDLGTLGGTYSDARGINDLGHVVGYSNLTGNARSAAWVYTGAGLVQLPDFGGARSFAEAINNDGVIVGSSYTGDFSESEHAFRYDNGVLTDLGTLGTSSVARDINEAGLVVGSSEDANGVRHGVLWTPNQMVTLDIVPGFAEGEATAINDDGTIVGRSMTFGSPPSSAAVVYFAWGTKPLDDLVGQTTLELEDVTDINDAGEIIGHAKDLATGASRTFIARPNPLVLAPPSPGVAGVVNDFRVAGANPGATVHVVYGTRAGTTDLSQWCLGRQLGMRSPTVGDTAVADASGVAVGSGLTPAGGSGVTVRYQAVELESCRVSDLVTYTYP